MAQRRTRPTSRSRAHKSVEAPQLAVCTKASAESQVREALSAFGTIEEYPPARLLILHQSPDASAKDLAQTIDQLRERTLVEYATPVTWHPDTGTRQILTDEITVRLHGDASREALSEMRRDEGVSVARRNEFVPSQYTLKVADPSGTRTLDVAKRLSKRPDVEFAAPNYIVDIKR
jgi:hypothetical protein